MITWSGKVLPDHHISYAFTCGETHYFNFTDAFSIPSNRAHDAIFVYQQYKGLDYEALKETQAAKKNLYLKNPISIFELKKLDDQIDEMLEMVLPPSRMAALLASVYYFDETENPYSYDRAYGEKKIEKWMNNPLTIDGEPTDFFLSPPIRNLMPLLELPEEDFQTSLKIRDLIDEQHLKTIFSSLSLPQQSRSSYKRHYSKSNTEKMSV